MKQVRPAPQVTARGRTRRGPGAGSVLDAELLLRVLQDLRRGNLGVRMPAGRGGMPGKIAAELNALIAQHRKHAEALAVAQEATRTKSAFLIMAAHELRTPLSVVIGYLSMLQDGTLPPERWQGPIEILASKAKDLNGIVNDLLTAACMEAGLVPTQLQPLDLREAAREAVARAKPQGALLQARLSTKLPEQPVFVDADRQHLARVLDNLLNNALIYCTSPPRVQVSVTDRDGPQLAVEDRGVGIAADLQERIFERFFRIDDPEVGPQPGTGLGLCIGRDLAQQQGGTLSLERSEVGRGSTFVLRLPPSVRRHLGQPLVSAAPASGEALGAPVQPVSGR